MSDVRRLYPGTITALLAEVQNRIRHVLDLHYADDTDRCVACDEPWPCETVELLA